MYPVYPYLSCLPMFTLTILYTLYTPIYPMFTHSFSKLCIPLNRLCREITKLVKRIGVESNCGPLFQTLTRPPNVLLWIIAKIKFSIEKWWCIDIKDRAGRLGATWGPPESLLTHKSNARGILAGSCWHLSTKFLIWLSKMQYFHFRSLIFAIMNKIIMNKINLRMYKVCLSFFPPDVFSSCSFIPHAPFGTTSVMVSCYGYEIWPS